MLQSCYANDLLLKRAEAYGQVRVYSRGDGKALPLSYVKVYRRKKNGQTEFHKDGYTDHRGCFDYVSLSQMNISEIDRFSYLIMNDVHGSLIQEAAPPQT